MPMLTGSVSVYWHRTEAPALQAVLDSTQPENHWYLQRTGLPSRPPSRPLRPIGSTFHSEYRRIHPPYEKRTTATNVDSGVPKKGVVRGTFGLRNSEMVPLTVFLTFPKYNTLP